MILFVNDHYPDEYRRVRPENRGDSDDLGFINIQNKFKFWFVLYGGEFYIINARRGINVRIVDQLSIKQITRESWYDSSGRTHEPVEILESDGK